MTSRKNQQATRKYMQTHDVSYMEALRRVTSGGNASKVPVVQVASRPLVESVILGYVPPLEPEPVKPTLMERLRGRHPEPGTPDGPTPYLIDRLDHKDSPSLVTVYGPPGTGKTVFLRSILEQYRGYAAYVVHDGGLIQGTRDDVGIEPWEGLTEINLQPWVQGMADVAGEVPEPPSFGDLPNGTLVVLDLTTVRGALEEDSWYHSWHHLEKVRAKLNAWFEFEASLGHIARSKSFTVASSVATGDSPDEMSMPLSIFSSPLGAASVKVRSLKGTHRGVHSPESRWAYEAIRPESRLNTEHFTLTEEEAARLTRRRSSDDEAERGIA